MAFQQFPIAGTALVRDAINSPNFVTHQQGWSINRDGTAEFNSVIVRGTVIASDFQSSNYVPGVSGFDLNSNTNSAEFNTGLRVGGAGNNRIQFVAVGSGTSAEIDFYTADPSEVSPARLGALVTGGQVEAQWVSPASTNGVAVATLVGSTVALAGGLFLATTAVPVTGRAVIGALVNVASNMQTYLLSTQSIASGENALITGDPNGTHLRYSGSEIQAVKVGGATSTLALNPAGSGVTSPGMRQGSGRDTAAYAGFIGTTYQNLSTVNVGLACPPSGSVIITVSATVTQTAGALGIAVLSGQLDNVTQGTTPHGPSDNDSAQVTATALNNGITLSRSFAVNSSGNGGDVLSIQPMMRVTAGTWTFQRFWVTVQPSF